MGRGGGTGHHSPLKPTYGESGPDPGGSGPCGVSGPAPAEAPGQEGPCPRWPQQDLGGRPEPLSLPEEPGLWPGPGVVPPGAPQQLPQASPPLPSSSYTVTTREFMRTDFLALPKDAAFQEILGVVTSTGDPELPVIDSAGTVAWSKQETLTPFWAAPRPS